MDTSSSLLQALTTPTAIVAIVLLIGLLLHARHPWISIGIQWFAVMLLLALSLPLTGHQFVAGLQHFAPVPSLVEEKNPKTKESVWVPEKGERPQAIVVLGGGRRTDSPEYGGDTVSAATLERLRYAAWLQRKTKLPILVTGGAPGGDGTPEADLMKAILTEEFRADVRWAEPRALNTHENAQFSKNLLGVSRIQHVYLVTHAWHMRRAQREFEIVGLQSTAAPTGFSRPGREGVANYLPSNIGLYLTGLALRERFAFLATDEAPIDSKPLSTTPAPAQPAAPAPAR